MPDPHRAHLSVVQDMIAAFPLPTLIIGQEHVVVALNNAAAALLGDTVLGRHFATAIRHPKLVVAVEHAFQHRTAQSIVYQIVEHGEDVSYKAHLQMIGDTDLVLLSLENVSGVEQAEQMRRDFIANVSHELRTPLTSVMGFIETMRGPARGDIKAQERFLAIMAQEAERMNRLVADLLSLSRVEANERMRPTTQVDLRALLQTTMINLAPMAAKNNVTVQMQLGKGPLPFRGDADQLMQVFTNLVENAIKYGGADHIVKVSVGHALRDPVLRGPAIEVAIADQGPGIAPHHLPRLTERFYRADSHRNRELGGTGLGLAIVKHILNRHRGRLKIASQLGQGARFTVVLPQVTDNS